MRSSLLVLLFAAMTMLAPAPAYADATSDIGAMSQAFTAVHSFHADITTTRGVMSMDVVKPDKFHMTMNGMMQVISIGTDMWANMNGSWQHMSMPAGMMQRPMDMARYAGMSAQGPSDYTITDLGPAMLAGVPTHRYHMVGKTGDTVDIWVRTIFRFRCRQRGRTGPRRSSTQSGTASPTSRPRRNAPLPGAHLERHALRGLRLLRFCRPAKDACDEHRDD